MIDYDVDGTDSDNTLDGFLRDRNEMNERLLEHQRGKSKRERARQGIPKICRLVLISNSEDRL